MSRFFCFLAFLAQYGFRSTVCNFYIEERRSMKFYVSLLRDIPNLTTGIPLTFIHSSLSCDILNY
jgi:hypothetical protein